MPSMTDVMLGQSLKLGMLISLSEKRQVPVPAMTLTAVDRLMHHATVFEMNVKSYRSRTALQRKNRAGHPSTYATARVPEELSRRDNQLSS